MAVCGTENGTTCVPTLKARSSHELVDCLKEEFPSGMETPVTIVEWFNGTRTDDPWTAYKLTFPQEHTYEDFNKANFNAALGQPRLPAGILYAESKDEVIEAVKCANKAGYKVSPRGRGHSYQGLSSMDGYLVIDMSLMCVPEEFIVTHYDDEPWVLGGGQKAIGSIKSGAGCTNAIMLAYTAETFPDGIFVIGSCPTVGITGKYHSNWKQSLYYLRGLFIFTFRLIVLIHLLQTFSHHHYLLSQRLCHWWRSR